MRYDVVIVGACIAGCTAAPLGAGRGLRWAAVDPVVGRRAYLFAMRAIPVSGFLNRGTVARSLRVALSGRAGSPRRRAMTRS